MHILSKFDKGIRFLLCVADSFNKHAWDVSLKGKKVIAITNVKKKLKTLFLGHMLLGILMVNKFLERFIKNNSSKQIEKSLGLKKVTKKRR